MKNFVRGSALSALLVLGTVGAATFHLPATAATQATGDDKAFYFAVCRSVGGTFKGCCEGYGGVYTKESNGQSCKFPDDPPKTPDPQATSGAALTRVPTATIGSLGGTRGTATREGAGSGARAR